MSERVHFRLVYELKKKLSIGCNTTSALMYSKPHAHVFTTKFSLTFTTALLKKIFRFSRISVIVEQKNRSETLAAEN